MIFEPLLVLVFICAVVVAAWAVLKVTVLLLEWIGAL